MRDRARSRLREAVTIAAAAGGAALGVGVAVAATAPTLVSAPQSAIAPEVPDADLAAPPAQVKGYTILRPSSLVIDTPSGLRILFGTGLAVTGLPELDASLFGQESADRVAGHTPPRHGRAPASAAPATEAPAPATAPAADAEPDFPGQGEEHRSETADPKRSERAEEQAEVLSADDGEPPAADDSRGRSN